VARTRTQRRRDAAMLRQGRFARGSTGQAQAPRRFARSGGQTEPARRFGRGSARPGAGAPGGRRRQPEQGGVQKLMQGIRGVLPGGGGKPSTKRSKRPGRSSPGVGGLVSSLGGKKGPGAGRGRKPAMFGLLGAGVAGAAAAVAKRRQGSRSSQPPAGETSGLSEPQTTSNAASTPAHRPDTPEPGKTAHGPDTPAEDETPHRPDTPAEGDQRG
jgi:hypothetical protein